MSANAASGSLVKQALSEIRRLRQKLEAVEAAKHEPIAIVGAGLRFPGGAKDPEGYYQQLLDGLDAIGEIPPDRWAVERYLSDDRDQPGTMYTRYGGFLADVAGFDPEFFGIAPVEAATIDPQQRLLLEVTWEALEHAGIAPASLRGSRTGVFVGIAAGDYGRLALADPAQVDEYASVGTAFSVAAGRLSYVLGLHGPSIAIDTACSASLVALHVACQSLRSGESELAVVGGVNLILSPEVTVNFCRAGMLAADGRCKTFDAAADGYVRSEGCGAVVLKRLSHAQRDGDRILAVVRGSAVNQDGRSSGLTAPNGPAQEAVIRAALEDAGVRPEQIGYVEAHGTGTSLGDPIELQALGRVFGEAFTPERPLLVGSVKTNVGHLEAAAGVAGLLKVIQSLRHGSIPAHLHLQEPNPHVAWSALPLAVPTRATPFPVIDGKRRAGISSFGFSGTNVHVVLEEAPAEAPDIAAQDMAETADRPLHVLALSASRADALRALAEQYAARLDHATEPFADLCHTANAGRSHFRHRVAVMADGATQAASALRSWLGGASTEDVYAGEAPEGERPGTAFLLGGASLDAGDVAVLRAAAPVFAAALDACAEAVSDTLNVPLIDVLQSLAADRPKCEDNADVAAATFVVRYALVQLWRSWGFSPDVFIADRCGEAVVAAATGALDLPGALRLVTLRAQWLQARDSGDRAHAARDEVEALLRDAGPLEPPVRTLSLPQGDAVTAVEWSNPAHWLSAARAGDPGEILARVRDEQVAWLIDVDAGAMRDAEEGGSNARAPMGDGAPWTVLLDSLARSYTSGAAVDWQGVDRGHRRRRMDLPTYPFQRRRFWLSRQAPPSVVAAAPFDAQAAWTAVARATAERAAVAPLDLNVSSYTAKWAVLAELTRELGRDVLARLGVFAHADEIRDAEAVCDGFGVPATYHRIVDRWLQALAADGTLQRTAVGYRAAQPLSQPDLAELWARVDAALADNRPLLDYLHNCATLLPEVVVGRTNPLETLFPDGSFEMASALYDRSAMMRYVNGIAAAALDAYVTRLPTSAAVRVLEAGAGTGGTTASLLPVLPRDRTTYDYTDVTDVFLEHGAERFGAFPGLRTRRFDLERPAGEQDVEAGVYDVIVAANAVHAVRDVRASLAQLYTLLAPGGLLLLVESTEHLAWHDFSTGLIEGWQHFTDDLRQDTPLLPATRWVELLRAAGFHEAVAAPGPDSAADIMKQHVLVAQKPGSAIPAGAAATTVQAMASDAAQAPPSGQAGQPALCPASVQAAASTTTAAPVDAVAHIPMSGSTPADTSSPAHSDFVVRLTEAVEAEREAIAVDAVRDCVSEILHADPAHPPGRDARLMELGVDSLMAVRLRNLLHRKLGLPKKLPATLIFDYPTIGRIAQLIVERTLRADGNGSAGEAASRTAAASNGTRNGGETAAGAKRREAEVAAMSDAEVEAMLERLETDGLA